MGNTTKADTAIEITVETNTTPDQKKKVKAKAKEKGKGKVEERGHLLKASVVTAAKEDTWHEIATADKERKPTRSNKTNRLPN
jgi:hypothetical protein